MSDHDPLLRSYEETIPGLFRVLRGLDVQQVVDRDATPDVRVIIKLQSVKDSRLLILAFEGVRGLRLTQSEWSLFELPVLEIRSIRERQLEGAHYEVRETDNDSLVFMCRTFSVRIEG